MSIFGHAPRALRLAVAGRDRIVIRRAAPGDLATLRRLYELADRELPEGEFILAESDGTLVAAYAQVSGTVVRDPFVATDDVVALLRLRASQLAAAA